MVPPRPTVIPQRMIRAGGAIVWRPVGDAVDFAPGTVLQPKDIEVLLVHRPRYRDWSWPKGKAELNEPLPVAAVREVEEEAGVVVTLHAPLTTQRYRLGSGHTKEVRYWVGRVLEDGPALAARPPVVAATKKEIDISLWCKPAKAKTLLTRRGDRRLLNDLVGRAARGELVTSTVILLRHAKAIGRSTWEGTEGERPLSRMGVRQSLDLVPQLSAFGAEEVYSSPWLRCEQTVAPYVALSRAQLTAVDALSEDGVTDDPAQSRALVYDLLHRPSGVNVVSLHRPGLPALLQPLCEESAAARFPVLDNPVSGLRTAEMFVVHISHADSDQVVEIERHSTLTKLALA